MRLNTPSRRRRALFVVALSAAIILPAFSSSPFAARSAFAQKKKKKRRKRAARKKAASADGLRSSAEKLKFLESFRKTMPILKIAGNARFTAQDLDTSLNLSLNVSQREYAPIVSDETFVRRLYLDLIGRIPDTEEIKAFLADPLPNKRAKLIDKLLESKAYARKWARYWRDVIFHESPANKRRVNPKALEDWFAGQFEKNVSWDRITAELVSATPTRNRKSKKDYGQNHGPNNFVLAYENKPVEVAAQTARIFMGISIQCAQCHDHPFDRWKREQFHEMVAFFAPGRYSMTDADDPAKKTVMNARFLLGETPPKNLPAGARRVAVAAYLIYNPGNYWFARAYVNRIWNELLGDGFYSVDSLGPDAEVVHKLVVNRLAAHFRYRQFDLKWVFRTIMNSRAYQRDIRTVTKDEKLFTGTRPSRLRPEQIASSLGKVIGRDGKIDAAVGRTFKVNPSIPQRDLEGSIQQALLLMNNRAIQNRLRKSPLKTQLLAIKQNDEMLDELYLAILARRPTSEERTRSLDYLAKVRNRVEAVEDLMWVLVNSAEFTAKR